MQSIKLISASLTHILFLVSNYSGSATSDSDDKSQVDL